MNKLQQIQSGEITIIVFDVSSEEILSYISGETHLNIAYTIELSSSHLSNFYFSFQGLERMSESTEYDHINELFVYENDICMYCNQCTSKSGESSGESTISYLIDDINIASMHPDCLEQFCENISSVLPELYKYEVSSNI